MWAGGGVRGAPWAPRAAVAWEGAGFFASSGLRVVARRGGVGSRTTLEQVVRDLAGFGYRQRLRRTLGGFSAFAAGFSYLSILTGSSQLFHLGYAAGGPAFEGHGAWRRWGRGAGNPVWSMIRQTPVSTAALTDCGRL